MHIRYPAVQGSFYPETVIECGKMIDEFRLQLPSSVSEIPRALIVPHAGWIYSGLTASFAYNYLHNFKGRRIVILAPSHHAGFSGITGSDYDAYLVNGQQIPVDTAYLNTLKELFGITFYEQAHKYEHSDEVQLPFINYHLKNFKIISLLYSYDSYINIIPLLKAIMNDSENLLIISSDLSHYHDYEKALTLDKKIINGVLNSDLKLISQGEACGKTGIMALVSVVPSMKIQVKLLDYRTSGDVSGDMKKVVGYSSFLFY